MISVIVLGTGNVGTHLINAFLRSKNVKLLQVYSRKKISLKFFEDKVSSTNKLEELKSADVYIIAINDDEISNFSTHLHLKDKLVVHTSGSVAMKALKTNANKGVFYPLQTFSKNNHIDFSHVPICLETENEKDLLVLEKVASAISNHVYFIDSTQRKQLHIAAVFTNNFVNHIYKIGFDICQRHNIPFETLHPLILETASKVVQNNPDKIQTGPAHRKDKKTIASHLALLSGDERKIYNILTKSIEKTYGKKL
jgi:predicted short-subunit dehydrogenase-like oxidoreductase (DUF2520 family)